jgi:hypothetical protein
VQVPSSFIVALQVFQRTVRHLRMMQYPPYQLSRHICRTTPSPSLLKDGLETSDDSNVQHSMSKSVACGRSESPAFADMGRTQRATYSLFWLKASLRNKGLISLEGGMPHHHWERSLHPPATLVKLPTIVSDCLPHLWHPSRPPLEPPPLLELGLGLLSCSRAIEMGRHRRQLSLYSGFSFLQGLKMPLGGDGHMSGGRPAEYQCWFYLWEHNLTPLYCYSLRLTVLMTQAFSLPHRGAPFLLFDFLPLSFPT